MGTKSNFGLGYSTSDMVLHTSLTNGSDFGGSVFQKLSPNLETGVTLGWSSANTNTKFGLGYQQKLRDGVTVTLSTLVNGANFNAGGHKIGVSLEMSAPWARHHFFSSFS